MILSINLGKGRDLRHIKKSLKVHRSVKARIERGYGGKPYVPHAQVAVNAVGERLYEFSFVE